MRVRARNEEDVRWYSRDRTHKKAESGVVEKRVWEQNCMNRENCTAAGCLPPNRPLLPPVSGPQNDELARR